MPDINFDNMEKGSFFKNLFIFCMMHIFQKNSSYLSDPEQTMIPACHYGMTP